MRRLLLTAGAAVVLSAAGPSPAPGRPASPVTNGYPYARACPAAGPKNVPDRWLMYECNCTSYAAWALAANGQRTDWFEPGEMDALNWPAVARAHGIPTGSRPRAGAVAVWPRLAPPFGHVAYVTGVARSGTFAVAEYNLTARDGASTYVFDRRFGLRPAGTTFIYVPRRD